MANYYRTRSPRRTRWTVFLADGTLKVVLAHRLDVVTDYLDQQGIAYDRVTPGDHRGRTNSPSVAESSDSFVPTSQRPLIVGSNRSGAYQLDTPHLARAIEEMGLKLQVRVRFNGKRAYGTSETRGNHRLRRDPKTGEFYHDIMLKGYLFAAQASHTLWHELRHAWQAEGQGSQQAWTAYQRQQHRYSYRVRPIEVDANQWADAHSQDYLYRLI